MFPHLFSVVPSDYYFAMATVHFINYYNWRRTVLITKDQEHNKKVQQLFYGSWLLGGMPLKQMAYSPNVIGDIVVHL